MIEFKNVSESVQVGMDRLGSAEIRQIARGSEPKSVSIDIYDIPTLIFALNDMLDEGRMRAHDFYQRYFESVARYKDTDEQQASAGFESVTPL